MEKKLKEKYMEYQMLERQIKVLTNQLEDINNKILELEYLKISLDEIRSVRNNSEILAPISQGIFIRAKVIDTDKLLVNVGGNSVVAKDVKSTQELLNAQQVEIEEMRHKLLMELEGMTSASQALEKNLAELTKDV